MAREHAVPLKLPTFWTAQPDVRFAQAEAQFNVCGIIAGDTKYYYVVAAPDTATRVLDLTSQSPDDSKYPILKGCLIDTSGLNKPESLPLTPFLPSE